MSSAGARTKTKPAAAIASSSTRREARSSSAGSPTSASSLSSSSRSDTNRPGSDQGKQRRTHTTRSASPRRAQSFPSARRSSVSSPADALPSSASRLLTVAVSMLPPRDQGSGLRGRRLRVRRPTPDPPPPPPVHPSSTPLSYHLPYFPSRFATSSPCVPLSTPRPSAPTSTREGPPS